MFFLFLDCGVQTQHFFAHAFILFDQRQVPQPDRQDAYHEEKEHDHAGEFIPQVDIHYRQ